MARLPSRRLVKRPEVPLADFVSEIRSALFDLDGSDELAPVTIKRKADRPANKGEEGVRQNTRDLGSELLFAEHQISLAVQCGLITAAIYVDEWTHFPAIAGRIESYKNELDAVDAELAALPHYSDDGGGDPDDPESSERDDELEAELFDRSDALEARKDAEKELNYPVRPGRYELSISAWTHLILEGAIDWNGSKVELSVKDLNYSHGDLHPLWRDTDWDKILKGAQIVVLDPDAAIASIFDVSYLRPDISGSFERFRTNAIPELFVVAWRYLCLEQPELTRGIQSEIVRHVLQYAVNNGLEPSESTVVRVVQAVLSQVNHKDISGNFLSGSIWGSDEPQN